VAFALICIKCIIHDVAFCGGRTGHNRVLLQRKTYLIKGYCHQKILALVAKLIFSFIKIRSCYLSVLTPKTVTEIQLFLDGQK